MTSKIPAVYVPASQYKQWVNGQQALTLPDAEPLKKPENLELSHQLSKTAAVISFAAGAAIYETYNYFAGMSIHAAASLTFAKISQLANQVAGALVVSGTVTVLGKQLLAAGALAVTAISAIAIAAKKLPNYTIFIQNENVGGKGMSLFEFLGTEYGEGLDDVRQAVFQNVVPQSSAARNQSREQIIEKMKAENRTDFSDKAVKAFHNQMIAQADLMDAARTDCGLSKLIGGADNGEAFDFIKALRGRKAEYDKMSTQANDFIKEDNIAELEAFVKKWGKANFYKIWRSINPNHKQDARMVEKDGKMAPEECMGGTCVLKLENAYLKAKQESGFPTLNGDEPLDTDLAKAQANLFDSIFTLKAAGDNFTPAYVHLLDPQQAENFGEQNFFERLQTQLDLSTMKDENGNAVTATDLEFFKAPDMQLALFALYHMMDLQLAHEALSTEEQSGLERVNVAKISLIQRTGTIDARARAYRQKVLVSGVGVLSTQECSKQHEAELTRELTQDEIDNGEKRFFKPEGSKPGTVLFLREDLWEADAQIIPHSYVGGKAADEDKLVCVLATEKRTGDRFFHVCLHGDASKAEDGRNKIQEAFRLFKGLKAMPGNEDLEMAISMDANTKKTFDIDALQILMIQNGVQYTVCGDTTVKVRGLTSQQTKSGLRVNAPGDHIAVKLSSYKVIKVLLRGLAQIADPLVTLPTPTFPSDHYSVSTEIQKVWTFASAMKHYLGIKKVKPDLKALKATFIDNDADAISQATAARDERFAKAQAEATAKKPKVKSPDERKGQNPDGDQFNETKGQGKPE